MDKFLKKILAFIRQQELCRAGDAVLVGFSGGADSLCLLHALKELAPVLKLRALGAVHVHHGLRGAEADRDEAFCRAEAERLQLPFWSQRVSVKELSEAEGLSLEEAARRLRYEALFSVREEFAAKLFLPLADASGRYGAGSVESSPFLESASGKRGSESCASGKYVVETKNCDRQNGVRLAVAHHADDQAETILFHLLRGTGLRGLSGMQTRREDGLIRPLLCVSRSEILAWFSKQGLSYVTDSTNACTDHTRNYLRKEILPALSSGVNSRASQHILSAGLICGEADAYLRGEAAAFLDRYAEGEALPETTYAGGLRQARWQDSETEEAETTEKAEAVEGTGAAALEKPLCFLAIPQPMLKEKPHIFRRYVIIEALNRLSVPLQDFGEAHLEALDQALSAGKGFHVDLPGNAFAENQYRRTVLYRGRPGKEKKNKN